MPHQPSSADSNISYERAATLQDLKEMAILDTAAQTPSPDLPRLARSFTQPAKKRGVGFGFESLEAEMRAYKLEVDEECRNQEQSKFHKNDNKVNDKFVVFKDEYEQPPTPRSLPSALFPLSTLSTPQPSESSPSTSTTHTASPPIHAAVLSQLSLISRERAGLLTRLQALHAQEQDLLKAHVDTASFTSPSTAEAQNCTQASSKTILSPSNLSPQPYTKHSTSATPSIRTRLKRTPLSTMSGPVLNKDNMLKPNMSSTAPRLPSHCTPSHVSTAKVPSSYQSPTHTSAQHISLRKDTTKKRIIPKAHVKPRTPLPTVPTPYKKSIASKLSTSKVDPRDKRNTASLVLLGCDELDKNVLANLIRGADASATAGQNTTGAKLGMSARRQDKEKNVKTPANGKVDKRGVTKGCTSAIPTTAGKKENVMNTPGTSKVDTLEGVAKTRTSGIPTSARKSVSKGGKTPGRENVSKEWNVPATVACKKWDF